MELTNEIVIEALNKVAKNFAELGRCMVNLIVPFMEQVFKTALILLTDNKRTLHLALNHSKARVRKKNFNRIIREIGRYGWRIWHEAIHDKKHILRRTFEK